MRKVVFFLLLAVMMPSCANADYPKSWSHDWLYGPRASFCAYRLYEAVSHNTAWLEKHRSVQGGVNILKFRYRKLTTVKIIYNGQDFELQPHYSGEFLQLSASCKGLTGEEEVPNVLRQSSRQRPNSQLVNKMISKGYDVGIYDGSMASVNKFFRPGQEDEQFEEAIWQTINYDLPNCDIQDLSATATINFGIAMTKLRADLAQVKCFGKRTHDWRELPMPIQRQITNAIELNWRSYEWKFIQLLSPK